MKAPMKAAGFAALLVSLSFCAVSAQARDTTHFLSIKEAVEIGKAQGLADDIKLYFGSQKHPAIETTLTKGISTNKKTNAANKSDKEACLTAMLSGLIQLQERARNDGGNAVINIESYYKKKSYKSKDKFECHAGNIMSGVALKGDVVKLKK
ncbi:MAG: excinuclease ATPase subunit [Proteobacteria bacterium]|nr:excinuclease ATPase subunit [Pseudomonadota bacterium]MCL2307549.1 excinuclease ATPase subunit [Pseudomonadota bacterium]